MTIWQLQSNFTKGELDPRITARTDLALYYNGVELGSNVLGLPQGGLKKRPGTEFIAEALQSDGRIEPFEFSTIQTFLLVFTNGQMEVYKEGVLQDTILTPWTLAQLKEMDYIQSANVAIVTHQEVAPRQIARITDTNWQITTIPLLNVPQFDFNDASSPTPVSEAQDIEFVGMEQGSTVQLGLEGILTDTFSYEGPNANMATAIRDELQALPNTGSSGISVTFQGGGEFNALFRVVFSGASAKNWRALTGFMVQGAVTGDERVNTTNILNGSSRSENVWSNLRGWPAVCTFHEGRLWFGSSTFRPQSIWGSVVNDFFNFDVGKARDDESISITLDTNQVNSIHGLISNRSLQIFTSGAEFYVPESPITPSNVSAIPQTNLGSLRVQPVALDGVTLFAQRTGKAIQQFVFLNDLQAHQTRNISVINPTLIKTPIQLEISAGSEESDANYLYILNDDGSLTVFNSQVTEDVSGFTRWETDGVIKSIAVVDRQLHLLVDRLGTLCIEREINQTNTDCHIKQTAINSDVVTGLDHLNNKTVDVKADGAYLGQFVPLAGQITLPRVAQDVEVGVPYRPEIRTMPLNLPLPGGPNYSRKKKVARCGITLFESAGMLVNGRHISDRTIAVNQFESPELQSGLRRIFLPGWSLNAQVTITQEAPFEMTVLGLALEVAV